MAIIDDYVLGTRRVLNDVSKRNIVDDAEIVDYVNEGRDTVAELSLCCRELISSTSTPSITFIPNSETITLDTRIISVFEASLTWSSTIRYSLKPRTWAKFSAVERSVPTYKQAPTSFCNAFGKLWLFPIPDMFYECEFECAIYPLPLALGSSADDAIPIPFRKAVKFFAAEQGCIRNSEDARAEKLNARGRMQLISSNKTRNPYLTSR